MYGIVKQSGGNIWVYSEPGQGTTFKIYLPRDLSASTTVTGSRLPAVQDRPTGTETVLLVEDEEAVRDVAKRILSEAGYTVLTAASPSDALLARKAHPGTIHLLLTDVVLPQMSSTTDRSSPVAVAAADPARRPTPRPNTSSILPRRSLRSGPSRRAGSVRISISSVKGAPRNHVPMITTPRSGTELPRS